MYRTVLDLHVRRHSDGYLEGGMCYDETERYGLLLTISGVPRILQNQMR